MSDPLTADILPRLASVRSEEWAGLFAGHPDPFELVRLIESSGMDGFSFSSVVVRQDGRPILLVPVFETVFDLASMLDGARRAIVRALARLAPSILRPRMLGIGFIEGEWGQVGLLHGLDGRTQRRAWSLASAAVEQLRGQRRANLKLCLNLTPQAAAQIPDDVVREYGSIETYPCGRVDVGFRSVDQYLARLSRSMRHDLRRKLRSAEHIDIRRTADPSPWLDRIMELYGGTVDRAELSLGRHRRTFFERVCREVPGAEYVLYLLHGRLIAFNLLVNSPALCVDKYFCMDPQVGREHNLYFVSWIENVKWCIERGIPVYHAGPGAEATKARLGARFIPSITLFHHANPIAQAIMSALRGLVAYRPAVDLTRPQPSDVPAPAALPAVEGHLP
ncbi:MAG: GNAT family N-acetyltransferase [Tepidisphaerales bacterium]